MRADDMVTVKAGLLVAFIKQASSIVNAAMQKMSGIKRWMLKRGGNGDVLQVGESDKIESLDMQNLEKPLDTARKHILENIAAAADMPALLLNNETFSNGFGEGRRTPSTSPSTSMMCVRIYSRFTISLCGSSSTAPGRRNFSRR